MFLCKKFEQKSFSFRKECSIELNNIYLNQSISYKYFSHTTVIVYQDAVQHIVINQFKLTGWKQTLQDWKINMSLFFNSYILGSGTASQGLKKRAGKLGGKLTGMLIMANYVYVLTESLPKITDCLRNMCNIATYNYNRNL